MQAPALSSLSATKQFESKKTEKVNNKIVIRILVQSYTTKSDVYSMSDGMIKYRYQCL